MRRNLKKRWHPLVLLTLTATFFLIGCVSSVEEVDSSRTGQGFQKPPRDRYILWESCQPGYRCEFLNSFGPLPSPQTLPPGQRCFGATCDKLESYGPNPNRQSSRLRDMLGQQCSGDDCEEYEEYGPNANRPKIQSP